MQETLQRTVRYSRRYLGRTAIAGVFLTALLPLGAQAMPTVAPEGLVMTVSGEATRLLSNDEATLTYMVEVTRQEAAEANDAVTAAAAKAVEALKRLEVEVRTTDFSTWAQKTRPREGEASQVTGWTSRETLQVKVRDLSRLPEVMAAAGETMQLDGITFSVSRKVRQTTQDELLAEAIQHGANRAVVAARALGLDEKNVHIEGISTGGTSGPSPRYYAQPQALMARAKMADSNAGALAAGTAETTVVVTLTVRIRP